MSPMSKDAAQSFRQDFARTAIGELSFPTNLDASRRVLQAIEKPDLSLTALSRIIVAEPLLSAKVMRLANSAALNPDRKSVYDLQHAVLCVGIDITKALAMVLILDQLRQTQRPGTCRDLANGLWERNLHVAALAYVIAKKLTRLNADEVMFAAIVRDLGRFYLLARAADYPPLLTDPALLAETVNDLADDASAVVLDKLRLPQVIVDAVSASRQGCATTVPQSAGEVLYLAGVVSPRRDPFDELDRRLSAGGETDRVLPPGFDQSAVAELITESGAEIYSIVVALES